MLLKKLYLYSISRYVFNSQISQPFKITLFYLTAQKMSKVLQPLFL
jgi:hypothetical protein